MKNKLIKKELQELFSGNFSFTRTILPLGLEMNGLAFFKKLSETCIAYEETGSYQLEKKSYSFFQKRYFEFGDHELHVLDIFKNTLHVINFVEIQEKSHLHECKYDFYDLDIKYSKDSLIMIYSVKGPRKNYISRTYLKKEII